MESIKVLIIEDERHIARLLEFVLQKDGYQVMVANTGKQGLMSMESFAPQIVLLDLGLPDMRGIEILKKIRAAKSTAEIKVMVLTASLYQGTSELLSREGADAQCSKPIAPTALINTLRSFSFQS